MTDEIREFIKTLSHPLKFRMFLITRLPSAYFSGLKLQSIDSDSCSIQVPFKWFTKNPFRSTYFACLAMAAEMSTGALAMAHLYKREPAVSMLVTGLKADYHKKATGISVFTCRDGQRFREAVEEAIQTNTPQTVIARSEGLNEAGDLIAEFLITWSFKTKTR